MFKSLFIILDADNPRILSVTCLICRILLRLEPAAFVGRVCDIPDNRILESVQIFKGILMGWGSLIWLKLLYCYLQAAVK